MLRVCDANFNVYYIYKMRIMKEGEKYLEN